MSYVEAILSAWDLLVICMMNFIRDLLCISSSGESKMLRGRHPIRGIFVFHVKDGGNRCSAVCNRIGSVLEALGCRFHPRPSELTIQRCCNYTSDLIPGQGTLGRPISHKGLFFLCTLSLCWLARYHLSAATWKWSLKLSSCFSFLPSILHHGQNLSKT